MGFLSRLFGKKETPVEPEYSESDYEEYHHLKMQGLEAILGNLHDLVGHALIPFALGGSVHMYYFFNHLPGTGFATMELLDPGGNGPKPNRHGTYELVAFTKLDYHTSEDAPTPFHVLERKACGFLTSIAAYASQAVLNPRETLEIPAGEGEENTCLILDRYEPNGQRFFIGGREHHLLLCQQVFRSEMEFAREHGSDELLSRLKVAGAYPYSDLDRAPVV